MKERLEQLKQQREALAMQLEEISFLITGYENTIKAQEEQAEQVDEVPTTE
jgi:hypothetical protein